MVCSAQPTRGLAFLYAESDIAALIGAARSLAPSGGLCPHTYATLIGLLACTGLRITEALTLRADDVDLSAGVLTIRQTKFRKSRLVPLHTSAVAPLRDYTADRDRRCDRKPDMTFFVSDTGHRLPYTTVRHAFHALLRQAMPGVVPVNRVRPLHDFRKNWTFLGSDRGGRMAAVLYSHTGTCKAPRHRSLRLPPGHPPSPAVRPRKRTRRVLAGRLVPVAPLSTA